MAAKKQTIKLEDLKNSVARKFDGENGNSNGIGVEIELLPLRSSAESLNEPIELSDNKKPGLCDLIKEEEYALNRLSYKPKDDGSPQFVTSDGGNITFEPGGQLEYSSSTNLDLLETLKEVGENIDALGNVLRKSNVWFFFGGVNPWHSLSEVDLKMKNPRYLAMDKYLESAGPYGKYMMRLTTSIQVNLDFGDRDTAAKRWRLANLLSPVMTALFSNSPYVFGRYSGAKSFRAISWLLLDKSRTGFPHIAAGDELATPEEQYLEFALKAGVINLPDKSRKTPFFNDNFSFGEWLEKGRDGFFPELSDWESHLTTLFPEARAKNFIEFRAFDGQSKAWWAVPAILLSSLLYDDDCLKKATDLLSPYYDKLDVMLEKAAVKGMKVFPDIAKKIFRVALNPRRFHIDGQLLEYCERFFKLHAYRECSPADHLLELNNFTVFSPEQYLEREIRDLEAAVPPESIMLTPSLDILMKKASYGAELLPSAQNSASIIIAQA